MGRARKAAAFKPFEAPAAAPIKLDFGCGPHKREGFLGVDKTAFVGVDHVVDVVAVSRAWKWANADYQSGKREDVPVGSKFEPWPWPDNSVAEAHTSHFLEHLTSDERIHFCNELYRVLVPGGTCQVIVPHWGSCRAYGDPTHVWPPMSEFWFYYLSAEWRNANAPHTDARFVPGMYACDFAAAWGYNLRGDLGVKNQEFQQFAIANYKEVIMDISATLTAVK